MMTRFVSAESTHVPRLSYAWMMKPYEVTSKGFSYEAAEL